MAFTSLAFSELAPPFMRDLHLQSLLAVVEDPNRTNVLVAAFQAIVEMERVRCCRGQIFDMGAFLLLALLFGQMFSPLSVTGFVIRIRKCDSRDVILGF